MLEVTTPAEELDLLTNAELSAAIGSPTLTTEQLDDLNARIAAMITRHCRVVAAGVTPPTLRQETLRETFRLKSRQDCLILARRPIVSVSSVTEAGTALTVADDIEIEAGSGLLRRLSSDEEVCWPCGKIVVTYVAGWDTVPDDLKQAAMKLAAVIYSEGVRVDPSLKRESIPGLGDREFWVSPNDDALIPAEVADLLAPYTNVVV
jgi:hypothetical protein